MKKITQSFLMLLLGFAGVSFAATTSKEMSVHLDRLGLVYPGPITAEYVTCQPSERSGCNNPKSFTLVIPRDGDQKVTFEGVDAFFVSLKTQEGRVIWGPHTADYQTNACGTARQANSFIFTLNNNSSVTCLNGIDRKSTCLN